MARCKYGKLKNPVGRRRCRKTPRKGGSKKRGMRKYMHGRCCVRRKRTSGGKRCAKFGAC